MSYKNPPPHRGSKPTNTPALAQLGGKKKIQKRGDQADEKNREVEKKKKRKNSREKKKDCEKKKGVREISCERGRGEGRREEEEGRKRRRGVGETAGIGGLKDKSAALSLTSSPSIPYLRIRQSTLPAAPLPPLSPFFFFFFFWGCGISPKCATILFFLKGIKYYVLIIPFLKE